MLAHMLQDTMTKENLSVRKAAQEIGISHSTITRILNNDNIDLQTYQQVCTWANWMKSVSWPRT